METMETSYRASSEVARPSPIPPPKSVVELIRAIVEFAVALLIVAFRRGPRVVGRTARSFGRVGARRFFYWTLEAAAYERRDSERRYRRWLRAHEHPTVISAHDETVLIVLTAIMDDAANIRCIESLVRQTHRAWRLVTIAAPGIAHFAGCDQRIELDRPHDARQAHSGPILLLDARSSLSVSALAELLACLFESSADVVYCDEDRQMNGKQIAPYLKPEFSIDLLRAEDYIGPTVLVRDRKTLCGDAFETCLRAYETRLTVRRLPRVLTHFHVVRDLELTAVQMQQVREHLSRCYGDRIAMQMSDDTPPETTTVSLIVPTRDRVDLLQACLDSVFRTNARLKLEVIVMNNGSERPESLAWLAAAPRTYENLRVIDAPYPFNWSKLNNHGIAHATGSVLVLLNNDVEVLDASWLDRLVTQCARPDVGTVGGLLLYPDGAIQHAGVVVGIFGLADHVYSGCPGRPDDRHPFTSPFRQRNVLASTGACLAVSRATLDKIGPFDETLAVCGDVELCIRAFAHGFLNVFDPRVRLLHHESATRNRGPLPLAEIEQLFVVCKEFIERGDPFYNPGLTRRLRYPEFARVGRPRC
jgi:GT2 family glycosyltransferase